MTDLAAQWATAGIRNLVAFLPQTFQVIDRAVAAGRTPTEYCDCYGNAVHWDTLIEMHQSLHQEHIIAEDFPEFAVQNAPKDTNPKTVFGQAKPSPSVVPPGAILECSMAMAEGNQKYGRTNWRDDPVSFSTYFDALLRHAYQAYDGEDRCPKSGALHMAHAMANAAIILDAMACGTLIDDRPTKGASSKLINQYTKEIAPHG